jgi:hypothetical protein
MNLPLLSQDTLVDPPVVRKILEEGWVKHFSLGLLTNEKCRAVLFVDQVPLNTVFSERGWQVCRSICLSVVSWGELAYYRAMASRFLPFDPNVPRIPLRRNWLGHRTHGGHFVVVCSFRDAQISSGF